ncbi:MAG TPA: hypothetical protein VF165_09815 [Nocardioidaceae bacterium]
MKKFLKSRTGAVLVGATALAVLGGTGAAAADGQITGRDIQDGSVWSRDVGELFSGNISNQSLRSWDLGEGSVGFAELKDDVESSFAKADHNHDDRYYTKEQSDAKYAQKSDIPAPGSTVTLKSEQGRGTVEQIGGSFTANATKLGEFTLEPGTYQLSSDGFFTNKAATSGQTQMQLALRTQPAEGEQWGRDLGTCFTGRIPSVSGRDITCATSRVVTVDAPTTVNVYGFGYEADGQGSADSGKVDAAYVVNILNVTK